MSEYDTEKLYTRFEQVFYVLNGTVVVNTAAPYYIVLFCTIFDLQLDASLFCMRP